VLRIRARLWRSVQKVAGSEIIARSVCSLEGMRIPGRTPGLGDMVSAAAAAMRPSGHSRVQPHQPQCLPSG
jgi:hypothetical protein